LLFDEVAVPVLEVPVLFCDAAVEFPVTKPPLLFDFVAVEFDVNVLFDND
jgi:hypothetical protein